MNDERAKHGHAGEHNRNVVLSMVEGVADCVCPVGYIFLVQLVFELLCEASNGYPGGTITRISR